MIRISKRLRDAFDKAAQGDFERGAAARLAREFPRHVAAMDSPRAYVRAGLERAARYAIDDEHGVDIYLNLMLLLGFDFDTDPQLLWAASILGDEGPLSAPRADCLHARALAHLGAVAGPDYEHIVAALQRFVALRFSALPEADLEASISEHLRSLYPEKHAYLGDTGARALAGRAARAAQREGLTDGRGITVYADMMFVLGSGVDRDPAYPWAAAALASGASLGPAERAQGLFEAVRAETARWVG